MVVVVVIGISVTVETVELVVSFGGETVIGASINDEFVDKFTSDGGFCVKLISV